VRGHQKNRCFSKKNYRDKMISFVYCQKQTLLVTKNALLQPEAHTGDEYTAYELPGRLADE